ncbi:type II toxin-antitoxin system Phd/YefM family antitoxin [Candidatus Desantisbacteria bacterium CG_4_10_14_0_8_um_filter_48_22]|uniref:Antitoxin n=1 Tax=Candidatus Desantisbacteria bacterium CG_4_10_14_0_8_um_filter_48_22 TaxID=1974543 RepID=A0A2M7S762_9BACT|nr:MAG: type II toxin-antitoxin system Phd/YefM family antitoxin [Candidatus Desantisbacteria bacterium CG_4_10_14_0_8_um_filter_48_22]
MNRILVKEPEVIMRHGKPSAVILDINSYRELLERAEDVEDLEELKQLRKKPLKFRKLSEFVKEYSLNV